MLALVPVAIGLLVLTAWVEARPDLEAAQSFVLGWLLFLALGAILVGGVLFVTAFAGALGDEEAGLETATAVMASGGFGAAVIFALLVRGTRRREAQDRRTTLQ